MMNLDQGTLDSFKRSIHRMADDVAADMDPPRRSLKGELERLRTSLEDEIDGYRHATIGITGVFAADSVQAISSLLAQSVVDHHHLTTTIARLTRDDVVPADRGVESDTSWQRPLRPGSLNIWPSVREVPGTQYRVDDLDVIQWLRTKSEFSVVTFDSLGDVITRLAVAKRLDGIVVVNSGREIDIELMNNATDMLERKGVRVLGQVRNLKCQAAANASPAHVSAS